MRVLDKALFDEISSQNAIFILYPKLGAHSESIPELLAQKCAMSGCSAQLFGYKGLASEFLELGFRLYAIGTVEPKKQEAFAASVGANTIEFISDDDFILERECGSQTFMTNSGFKFYFRQNLIFRNKKLVFSELVKDAANDAFNTLEYVKKSF